MPTSAKTPDKQVIVTLGTSRWAPASATHLSRWVHPNGTTESRPGINDHGGVAVPALDGEVACADHARDAQRGYCPAH
jgi:hypothetical protein